ncbi:MAG: SPOR domain-containing protein [Prevotellaceae bacterium]|jgi:hypothetical protein|nr:SPOR domain-containing protein [Prevotellaceae bacterium]
MNKKNVLYVGILLAGTMLSVAGNAQDLQDSIAVNPLDSIAAYDIFDKLSETAEGKVILGGDDVKSIINEMKTQKNNILKGWRIRIFRDSSQAASRKAESIKSDIEKTFPGVPVYIRHDSPHFYVEVGDYRTRDDAEKMKRTLRAEFPGASIVPASINFPPL